MGADDVKNELIELRERVVHLETKFEEVDKRLDNISKFMRELYDYLQKQHR